GDLGGEPFLYLRAAGEELYDASELRQPENARARQITDRSRAGERKHVVLAQRGERYVARDDQLVVLLVVRKRRQRELARGKQLLVAADHACRRARDGVVVEVEPERAEQIGGRPLCGLRIDPPLGHDP